MISKESLTIKLKDGRIVGYAEYGDSKGKPIFFLHGWPSSRLQARPADKSAKRLGVHIVSLDRPGYGLSDFKKNRTFLEYPDEVLEIADKLGIKKFAVMGVSGGGPYAAACAYKIPNRLTKVGIIVGFAPTWVPGVLNEMSFTGKFGWANYKNYPILAYLGSKYHEFDAKYFSGIFSAFEFRAPIDQKVLKTLKNQAMRNKKEAFRQGSKGAEKDLQLYSNDWGFKLEDIKAKVYLFYGEEDRNVTIAMANYYASHIKNAKLKVYANEGHLISITHIKEILKTLTE